MTTYGPDYDTLVLIAYAQKTLNRPMLTYPVELEILILICIFIYIYTLYMEAGRSLW